MLRCVKGIIGYTLQAKDGEVGQVEDFYFDDETWHIRYLVAKTGKWLYGKKVLIAPAAFEGTPDWTGQKFPLSLTKEKIKESPEIDTDKPVSRQQELDLSVYYNWPFYWRANPLEPGAPVVTPEVIEVVEEERKKVERESDSHLRSCREILGYDIAAEDDRIGKVTDFILSDENWAIRYLAADIGGWLPGREVILSPAWTDEINWAESKISFALSKEEIKNSPPYKPSEPVNRAYEKILYDYYGRPKYW